jgi:HlyD family secretion protein
VLVTAAAAGAAGFYGQQLLSEFGGRSKPPARPDRPEKVTARGRLEPETEIVAVGLPTGTRVQRLEVTEDRWVKKGEPLAYLDSYDELQAARNSAAAQLAEAKKRLEAEVAFGNANVEAARLRVRQVEEVSPTTVEAQKAEVRRSEAELKKARLDLQRSQQMLDDKAIPQSNFDAVALVERQAAEQLKRNEATLKQLELDQAIKGPLARAEVKSAEAGSLRAQLAAQVDSLAAALKAADARLDRAVISAPIDGQVLKIFTHVGEAAGREPLLKMGNTHAMYAVAEVYETDAQYVKKGQRAAVTSKAFPDKLAGVVERVAILVHKNDVLGIDPAADADTRTVEVRIRLDESSVAARYNQLQVDVEIDVAAK